MQVSSTSGQQHTGRFAVLDDVAVFGTARAVALLCDQGALGLFAHTRADVSRFAGILRDSSVQATAHAWNLHHGGLPTALDAVGSMPPGGLPSGWRISVSEDHGVELTQRCRDLMQQCGVMPASVQTLRGLVVPSLLAAATDAQGRLIGVGSLLWGHCPQGPWRGHAHLGMVCVADMARGGALGRRLSAALIRAASVEDGTGTVSGDRARGIPRGFSAACAGDNPASAAMLLACGLRIDPERVCVMFTLDGTRKTR